MPDTPIPSEICKTTAISTNQSNISPHFHIASAPTNNSLISDGHPTTSIIIGNRNVNKINNIANTLQQQREQNQQQQLKINLKQQTQNQPTTVYLFACS